MIRRITGCFILVLIAAPMLFAENGLGIDDLLRTTRQNNYALRRLRAEGEKSRIDLKAARAGRLPDIDFDASFSYLANPMDPVTLTAGELGTVEVPGQGEVLFPPEDMRIFDGMENTYYSFELTVDQPVFTWGKIPNTIRLYSKGVEANGLETEKTFQELSAELTGILYTIYFMEKLSGVLSEQSELADRMTEIARESYKNGFILYADVLNTEIKAKEIGVEQRRLEKERGQLLSRLRSITGQDGLDVASVDFGFVDEDLAEKKLPDAESLIKRAERNNADLQLLSKLKEIDNLKLKIAEGTGYLKPDLGLRMQLSYSGPRLPLMETDWLRQDDYGLTLSVGISTKVYDGGRLASEIALSRRETEISVIKHQEALSQVADAIRNLLLNLELAKIRMEYELLKKESSEEMISLEKAKHDAGAGSETDYLRTRLEALTHLAAYYTQKITFFQDYITLKVLAGEFDPESL